MAGEHDFNYEYALSCQTCRVPQLTMFLRSLGFLPHNGTSFSSFMVILQSFTVPVQPDYSKKRIQPMFVKNEWLDLSNLLCATVNHTFELYCLSSTQWNNIQFFYGHILIAYCHCAAKLEQISCTMTRITVNGCKK